LIGVALSIRTQRALQRIIGRLAIGEGSTLFLDLLVQCLYLIVSHWIVSGFKKLVDSCSQIRLGAVELVFGSGDVEPGTRQTGQIAGFVGGGRRAFLQPFDKIVPQVVH